MSKTPLADELSMWKLVNGISLTLCLCQFVAADQTDQKPFVRVKCHGRLRDGVVAIGGETTGTTITFYGKIWELQLDDDADRAFAKVHHKEPVIATGTLRRVAGVATTNKERWIINVEKISEPEPTTEKKEGALLIAQGMLRSAPSPAGDSVMLTIAADDQIWPLDFPSDASLRNEAESLVDQSVLLKGILERVNEKEPGAPLIIRVKELKRSAD